MVSDVAIFHRRRDPVVTSWRPDSWVATRGLRNTALNYTPFSLEHLWHLALLYGARILRNAMTVKRVVSHFATLGDVVKMCPRFV